jgi:hypothetical protein
MDSVEPIEIIEVDTGFFVLHRNKLYEAKTALRFRVVSEIKPNIGPQTAQCWAVAGNPFGI